jgi:hypothetical protein
MRLSLVHLAIPLAALYLLLAHLYQTQIPRPAEAWNI